MGETVKLPRYFLLFRFLLALGYFLPFFWVILCGFLLSDSLF